ncbi:conserved Plasmodium protein, unknown function [Plasmodium relictum]|uniref:Pinin/SDK/MemA protein domain-containing protein n=1 Tax=Plasmodium relictum TaxID=85471 RepID=A0A1J1HEV1_PLARL|nr:conserved Plasmodium protein, unknown function [Plasmodium relictum]CRH02397.1 conserved Plasmodium protein, unknown function [Plasmodium relictum]
MKDYLLEEDKLKLNIRKCYFERDVIKSKIVNYLNRLTYLSSDDRDENNNKTKQKRMHSSEYLDNLPDFKIEKRPKLEEDESTVTRNKRLLQIGLFDHLKKAKDALEQEKSSKTVIQHHLQSKKVEEKIKEEKKNFEKSELEDMEKKIIAYVKDIKKIEKSIKHDEGKLMKLNLINHYDKMKNFISTNTYPTIFWCPLKFNEKTKILQKNTENFIKKKINAIKSTNYEVNFKEENWLDQFQELKKKVEKKNKISDNVFENNNSEKEKNDLNEKEKNDLNEKEKSDLNEKEKNDLNEKEKNDLNEKEKNDLNEKEKNDLNEKEKSDLNEKEKNDLNEKEKNDLNEKEKNDLNEKEKNDLNENENNIEYKNENNSTEEIKQNNEDNNNKEFILNNDKNEESNLEGGCINKNADNDYQNITIKENLNKKVKEKIKKNSHEKVNKKEEDDSNEVVKEHSKNTVKDNPDEDVKENSKNKIKGNSNENLIPNIEKK